LKIKTSSPWPPSPAGEGGNDAIEKSPSLSGGGAIPSGVRDGERLKINKNMIKIISE